MTAPNHLPRGNRNGPQLERKRSFTGDKIVVRMRRASLKPGTAQSKTLSHRVQLFDVAIGRHVAPSLIRGWTMRIGLYVVYVDHGLSFLLYHCATSCSLFCAISLARCAAMRRITESAAI